MLYESKQLTTHAVCVGMTGSGKTGLCLALLEEAAIDGIPVIAIDPKGDLGNLLLTLSRARGRGFRALGRSRRGGAGKGLTREQFADQTAEAWREGLADWGQDGARIERLRDAADVAIYTPGQQRRAAADGAALVRRPAAGSDQPDARPIASESARPVSGLLALLGIDGRPDLAAASTSCWPTSSTTPGAAGRDLDMAGFIHAVQTPPFDKVGVIDLETFFPAKERFALAMKLNNLLASPGLRRLDGGRAARRRQPALHAARASRGCRSSRSPTCRTTSGCSS